MNDTCLRIMRDRYSRSEMLIYAVAWLLIFSMPLLSQLRTSSDMRFVYAGWAHMIPFFVVFLVNDLVLLPSLLLRGRKVWYVVAVVTLLTAVWWLVGLNHTPPHRGHMPPPPVDMFKVTNVVIATCVIFANVAIKMYFLTMRKDMKMLQIRNEQMHSELESLKYQINPHFLMNTLNNIQALVELDPAKACDSIQRLSRMMRHMLYDVHGQTVMLRQEAEFIEHYIGLMRIRYPESVRIQFQWPWEAADVQVPSLLFIACIENAFKHGVSYRTESFISVDFTLVDSKLLFRCANSKRAEEECRSDGRKGGIGLENMRRRLELLYPQGYTLAIDDQERSYIVELEIPVE